MAETDFAVGIDASAGSGLSQGNCPNSVAQNQANDPDKPETHAVVADGTNMPHVPTFQAAQSGPIPTANPAMGQIARGGPLPVPKRFVPYYDVLRKRRESWSNFPSGLRVLVADNEPASLQVVEKMLKKCDYQVTLCSSGKNSMEILRKRREEFDIVLAEASLPDIDGFKILDVCSKELSLPVVLMSASGETSSVMRGVMEGARDFLLKPLRHEELKTLWQHVVRYTNELTKTDGGLSAATKDAPVPSKAGADTAQKSTKSAGDSDKDSDSSSSKKQRVIWSAEMHQQFVAAVNQLGIDKAVPKRILDLMNIKGLTRENVASHLQKYRLYLKRMANTQDGSAAPGLGSTEGFMSNDVYPMMVGNPDAQTGSQGMHGQPTFHYSQQSPSNVSMAGNNPQMMQGMHVSAGAPGVMPSGQLAVPQQMMQMSNGSHMFMALPQQHMHSQGGGMMTQDMMQGQAGMTMLPNGMMAYPMVQVQQQQGRVQQGGDMVSQVKTQQMQQHMGYVNPEAMNMSMGEMQHMGMSEAMYGSGAEQQRQAGNWQQLQGQGQASSVCGWSQEM